MNKYSIPNQDSDQEKPQRLEFRFLLAGANHSDDARRALLEELQELIANIVHLNLLPVNQGLHLDLEVGTIEPFAEPDYEAYLVDHILSPVLNRTLDDQSISVRIQPLRSRRA